MHSMAHVCLYSHTQTHYTHAHIWNPQSEDDWPDVSVPKPGSLLESLQALETKDRGKNTYRVIQMCRHVLASMTLTKHFIFLKNNAYITKGIQSTAGKMLRILAITDHPVSQEWALWEHQQSLFPCVCLCTAMNLVVIIMSTVFITYTFHFIYLEVLCQECHH